jgi:hypothetical protein
MAIQRQIQQLSYQRTAIKDNDAIARKIGTIIPQPDRRCHSHPTGRDKQIAAQRKQKESNT